MTRFWRCDQCTSQQETPLPFEVTQRLDELDDDGDPVAITLDICSVVCLSDFAMGLQMEFPDDGEANDVHIHPTE